MFHTTIKEWATAYSRLNLSIFPCHGIYKLSNKCTCGRTDCKEKNWGKHPKTINGWKDASSDVEKFRYPTDPQYNNLTNLALATGSRSKKLVIDIDNPKDIESLESKYGPLPLTWKAKTGREGGGYHYYFEWQDDFKNVKNTKLIGYDDIDIRADGGYIMLPPSRHRSGNEYQWVNDPESTPLAPAPDWLVALLPRDDAKAITSTESPTSARAAKPRATSTADDVSTMTIHDPDAARVAAYLAKVPPAIEHEGNMMATWQLACRLVECFGHFRTDEQLFDDLQTWNASCSPPWTDKELRRKISDARKKTGIVCHGEPPGEPVASNADPKQPPTITATDSLPWPTLDDHAFYGIAGDIVKRIEPQSETDPVALLTTLLTSFGVAVGRSPYYLIEGTKHHANVYSCLVGRSSRARKGTSLGRIRDVMRDVTPPTISGLSSGEGLIHEVRDASTKPTKDGSFETIQGIDDKRLWIIESELARTLSVIGRDGNTLSPIMRDAWDDGELRVATRSNPIIATDAHIGMTAHITLDELSKTMSDQETFNGFANRFMFCCVKRSKLLPDGGDDIELSDLRSRLAAVIDQAKRIGRMTRSDECRQLWRKCYAYLVAEKSGTYDAITSRAEAITLRLSMLYALMDGSSVIETDHLRAALSLWCYCDHSAEYLFSLPDKRTIEGEANRQAILAIMNEQLPSPSNNDPSPTRDEPSSDVATISEQASSGLVVSESESNNDPQVTNKLQPIQAATLAELFDYRNSHEGRFTRRADGMIVLSVLDTPDIPPAITQAVIENQTILASLVTETKPPTTEPPPPSESLTFTIQGEPATASVSNDLASDPYIAAMRDAAIQGTNTDPELQAFYAMMAELE